MKDKFFEGKDYDNGKFKALMPRYYPLKYKKYIKEENVLLKTKVKGAHRVLEAGVGVGRLVPELAPLVGEFIGIDAANLMLKKSRDAAKKFSNVKIVKGQLEELSFLFPKNYFDYSLCVWNTLGNVANEAIVLRELKKVTKKAVFITVYRKGTLADRKKWYASVDVPILKIDEKNEIFYSKSGLRSKSYSIEDIEKISKAAKLKVKNICSLAEVMFWFELGV